MLQTSCDAEILAPISNSKSCFTKCDAFTIEESEESGNCDSCREGSDDLIEEENEKELSLTSCDNESLSDCYHWRFWNRLGPSWESEVECSCMIYIIWTFIKDQY